MALAGRSYETHVLAKVTRTFLHVEEDLGIGPSVAVDQPGREFANQNDVSPLSEHTAKSAQVRDKMKKTVYGGIPSVSNGI